MAQPPVFVRPHLPVVLAAAGTLILAGCASNQPLTTSSINNGYILSAAEMSWHCGGLENAVNARVAAISALSQQAKANADATAPTVSAMLGRAFGHPVEDGAVQSQIKAERAAADAYNTSLANKGCPKVDIDAKLAASGTDRPV